MSETPQPSTKTKKPSLLEHPLAGKIVAGLLVLSLIVLFIQWKATWFSEVISETEGKPRWTYLVPLSQAAVTALAGIVAAYLALWQFNRTHKQRDDQFERKHLEDQFVDIQNRLSSENPSMRANAALRLAQLAETLRPGSETTDYTLENNPFFARATSQLCIALNMEKDYGVRTAIVDALNNLRMFAHDKPSQELLVFLIHSLTDANRAAYRNFLKALAAYWVAQPQAYIEKTWEQLAVAASFCEDEALNKSVLKAQTKTTLFLNDCHILKELRRTTTNAAERKKADATLITDTQESADRLKQTRDVLAYCLQAKRSTNWRQIMNEVNRRRVETGLALIPYLPEANQLKLKETFLVGANIFGAHLQHADLQRGQLQGANLTHADLHRATVCGSNLDEAKYVTERWREANFRNREGEDTELYARMEARFGKKETEKQAENRDTMQAVFSPIATTISPAPSTEENIVIAGEITQNDA